MSEEAKTADPRPQAPLPPQTAPAADYSSLSTVYTNFARVNVTPEELILDFGLNPEASPTPSQPVKMTHRVVMNFYTAKRLYHALAQVVHGHERQYGPMELDFQKRKAVVQNLPEPEPAMEGSKTV